ncbi:hypothetical protein V1286_001396 [Bradyrhizobium algeriense]|uniref:Uncharacterized protein n=1 Tax=Bradyrhizobium algeriense TaxID=634784 RepID=A0ABU8B6R8_9BRAD
MIKRHLLDKGLIALSPEGLSVGFHRSIDRGRQGDGHGWPILRCAASSSSSQSRNRYVEGEVPNDDGTVLLATSCP